ncbi:MAG: hypothetical protein Ct9H300mP9_4150 [Candidatus Neomarinimicrobiota bacterium]|nr:MAG: hypothetical protein Ct9H300mP9_4150 [Candidatus Neomarinimicrobiota bacterium]
MGLDIGPKSKSRYWTLFLPKDCPQANDIITIVIIEYLTTFLNVNMLFRTLIRSIS